MAEKDAPTKRGAKRGILSNDECSFGYWETDNNPAGEYVAASTYMPNSNCNVSGNEFSMYRTKSIEKVAIK